MNTTTDIPDDLDGYHRGIAEGLLRAPRCQACGEHHWPPRAACPHCQGLRFDWETLPAEGELFTWTVVGHTVIDEFRAEVPFPVGMIAFPGLGIRLIGRIDADARELRIGQPLRWHPAPDTPAGVIWRPSSAQVVSE